MFNFRKDLGSSQFWDANSPGPKIFKAFQSNQRGLNWERKNPPGNCDLFDPACLDKKINIARRQYVSRYMTQNIPCATHTRVGQLPSEHTLIHKFLGKSICVLSNLSSMCRLYRLRKLRLDRLLGFFLLILRHFPQPSLEVWRYSYCGSMRWKQNGKYRCMGIFLNISSNRKDLRINRLCKIGSANQQNRIWTWQFSWKKPFTQHIFGLGFLLLAEPATLNRHQQLEHKIEGNSIFRECPHGEYKRCCQVLVHSAAAAS